MKDQSPLEYWNDRYKNNDFCYGKEPNAFLFDHVNTLPKGGKILCLLEGEGRNAVFLVRKGFQVTAIDLSTFGREKAMKLAEEFGVKIRYDIGDIDQYDLGSEKWDGIISISAHLPRQIRSQLHKKVVSGLKSGGIFLLEGYNQEQLRFDSGGPKDADMLFSKEELEDDFEGFTIHHSKNIIRPVNEGEFHTGDASVIQFIAKKEDC